MGRLLPLALAVLAACQGRDDLDGKRRPIPGLSDRGDRYDLRPEGTRTVLDLFDNRAAAVVHAGGGLTIECGTADIAKYVEGAYRSSWHLAAQDGGKRVALIDGLAGELYFPLDQDPGGVVTAKDGSLTIWLRARAAKPRQLVSVFMNEKRLGDISMPTTDWETYSIRAPAATLIQGENKLRFYFRHTGEIDGRSTAAAIERIRLGGPAETPGLRAESVTHGQRHLDALRVKGPARLSYAVRVPAGKPALVFAAATGGPSSPATVQIAGSDGTTRAPWQGAAGAEWERTRVDLSAWSGEVVRIDLISAGAMDWGQPQLIVPEAPASAAPGRRPPADHVIIWVVSALRADRLGGEVPTPGFDALASRGIRFTSAHTAAPVPAPAHVAMMSGQEPRGDSIPVEVKTLGERFGEAGYMTALISGNGFVNDDAGFAQGFAVYRNPMRRRHPFRAPFLWQQARRVLQQHKNGRTFLYLATVEPHLPYHPTADSLAAEWDRGPMRFAPTDTIALSEAVAAGKQQLVREEQSYIEALYNAEIRDADAAFASMLADLDELGVRDRTAVILAGDHGEELWERGAFGHGSHLYQEVVHVPLIVAPPGMRAPATPATVDSNVSLVDVYATALDLAGITAGPDNHSASLLDPGEQGPRALPRPLFSYLPGRARALRLGRYKLIVPVRGRHELYDLIADPDERQNLMDRQPIVARYMRNVFGIGVAYQSAWSRSRWGTANNMSPAFAADHGL